jgi:hypothetical protein
MLTSPVGSKNEKRSKNADLCRSKAADVGIAGITPVKKTVDTADANNSTSILKNPENSRRDPPKSLAPISEWSAPKRADKRPPHRGDRVVHPYACDNFCLNRYG